MQTSFELILISPEQDLAHELTTVCRLFNSGLRAYHIRKPHWDIEKMKYFLASVPEEFLSRLVLHSHFELTKTFAVKGIHLNENAKQNRVQVTGHKIVSASFHALSDIKENTLRYEYVFLSPVFDSISKPGYSARFDLKSLGEELAILNNQKSFPKIIALGGINASNVMLTQSAGFAGAALLGAVWQSESPVEAFLQIQLIVTSGA